MKHSSSKKSPTGGSVWLRAIQNEIKYSKFEDKIRTLEHLLHFVKEASQPGGTAEYERDDRTGKIGILIRSMTHSEQGMLLGLNARYPEFVHALVTHDLNSGRISDIGGLLTEIRLDDRFEY